MKVKLDQAIFDQLKTSIKPKTETYPLEQFDKLIEEADEVAATALKKPGEFSPALYKLALRIIRVRDLSGDDRINFRIQTIGPYSKIVRAEGDQTAYTQRSHPFEYLLCTGDNKKSNHEVRLQKASRFSKHLLNLGVRKIGDKDFTEFPTDIARILVKQGSKPKPPIVKLYEKISKKFKAIVSEAFETGKSSEKLKQLVQDVIKLVQTGAKDDDIFFKNDNKRVMAKYASTAPCFDTKTKLRFSLIADMYDATKAGVIIHSDTQKNNFVLQFAINPEDSTLQTNKVLVGPVKKTKANQDGNNLKEISLQ